MTTQVTQLLQRLREGEQGALDELMPLVYGELRRMARSFMQRQQPGHTLQPTALVNEAFIKLFGGATPQVADRAHFLALMSRVMRQVLVDHARASGTAKRGGREARVPWDTNIEVGAGDATQHLKLLDLHRVLETLERENQSLAQVVEMHYFGGMTAEEVAAATGRSAHVVRHELRAGPRVAAARARQLTVSSPQHLQRDHDLAPGCVPPFEGDAAAKGHRQVEDREGESNVELRPGIDERPPRRCRIEVGRESRHEERGPHPRRMKARRAGMRESQRRQVQLHHRLQEVASANFVEIDAGKR